MKNLILVFLLFPSVALCQSDIDSLRKEIASIRVKQDLIDLRMDKMHKQYQKGTAGIMAGTGMFLAGSLIIEGEYKDFPELIYLCSAITTIGIVLQIDSHKYLNKKRRLKFN